MGYQERMNVKFWFDIYVDINVKNKVVFFGFLFFLLVNGFDDNYCFFWF